MAKPTDLYMQYVSIPLDCVVQDINILVEASINTGLSLRGNFAWLIHEVEFLWYLDSWAANSWFEACLTSRIGETVMPQLENPGVIDMHRMRCGLASTANDLLDQSKVYHHLPPVPFAGPKLSLYLQAGITGVNWYAGRKLDCRIGFTTQDIDSKMYLELAETWGYQAAT